MSALLHPRGQGIGSYDPSAVVDGDPTDETYADLNRAFRFFNERLFDGKLEPSLITLRARGRTNGYFSSERFVHADGRKSHEIALNPEMFACFTIERSLSTLVHEQVHQIQFQEDTFSRRGYHNTDFAQRMEAIGLMPSSTGRPGGAKTGEKVTHYLIPGGRFLTVVRELLDDSFRARWADRFVTVPREEWLAAEGEGGDAHAGTEHASGPDGEGEPRVSGAHQGVSIAVWPNAAHGSVDGAELSSEPQEGATAAEPHWHELPAPAKTSSGCQPGGEPPAAAVNPRAFVFGRQARTDSSKTKFVCGSCHSAAWGKQSLNLVCGDCKQPMPSVHQLALQESAQDDGDEDR